MTDPRLLDIVWLYSSVPALLQQKVTKSIANLTFNSRYYNLKALQL